jgi:hypothetical protein
MNGEKRRIDRFFAFRMIVFEPVWRDSGGDFGAGAYWAIIAQRPSSQKPAM